MPVAVGVLLVLLGVLAVALLLVVRASAECRLCFNGTKGEARLCLHLLFGLLPVRFALTAQKEERWVFCLRFPLFRLRFTQKEALKFWKKRRAKRRQKKKGGFAQRLLSAVWVEGLCVRMELGTNDAAACALLCGAAGGLLSALFALAQGHLAGVPRVAVQPRFHSSQIFLEVSGIVRLRAEKTIAAR